MVMERKLVTVEEFEAFTAMSENRDRYFELIHGEIVEKAPTQKHGIISVNITTPIKIYVVQHGNKDRIAVEVRHHVERHNSRQPDISFYADNTIPIVERGAMQHLPDLAVEIKSPDDSVRELREKAEYYLAHGSRMVWLIFPEKRLVEVYTLDDVLLLTEGDTLDGGEVLPGFSLPVNEIFNV